MTARRNHVVGAYLEGKIASAGVVAGFAACLVGNMYMSRDFVRRHALQASL